MKRNSGLIDSVVLIVVALIILGYFNINIKDIFSNTLVKENLNSAWNLLVVGIHQGWQYVVNLIRSFIKV